MKKDYLLKATAILVGSSTCVFSMESNFEREFNQRRAEFDREFNQRSTEMNREFNQRSAEMNREFNQRSADMNRNSSENTQEARQRVAQREAEQKQRLAEAQQRRQDNFQQNQPTLMAGFPGPNSHSNQAPSSFGNLDTLFHQFQNEMGKQNVFQIDPSFRSSMNNMENFLSNSGSNKSIDSIPLTNNNSSYKSPSSNSSTIKSYSSPSYQKVNNSSVLDKEPRDIKVIPTQNKIESKDLESKKEIKVVEQNSEDRDFEEAIRQSLLISEKSEIKLKAEEKSKNKDLEKAKNLSLLESARHIKKDDSEDLELAEAIRLSLLESTKDDEEKSQVISTVDIAEIIKGLPADTDQNDLLKVVMATGKYRSEQKVIETLKDMLMWFDD